MDFISFRRNRMDRYADEPRSDAQTFFNGGLVVDPIVAFSEATVDVQEAPTLERLKEILRVLRSSVLEKIRDIGYHDRTRIKSLIADFEEDAYNWFVQIKK
jgi:hypothetical protein